MRRYSLKSLAIFVPNQSKVAVLFHRKQPKATKNDPTWRSIKGSCLRFIMLAFFSDDMHFLETPKMHLLSNMAIFGVPNLNFREIYPVSCTNLPDSPKKNSAKGRFLLIL